MDITVFLNVVMPFIFFAVAGFLFFIALRTLIGRRPVLFSARWLYALICLALSPSLLLLGIAYLSGTEIGLIGWVEPLLFVVVLAFLWIQMQGYLVYAASEMYFREALLAAASGLGFTVEETLSRLKIKETGQEIQIALHGWMGTGQLKPAGKDARETVDKIAQGMDDYFQKTQGQTNYMASYFFLILGGCVLALAIWMFMLKL